MSTVRIISQHMSLSKSLRYIGMSKSVWYYTRRHRAVSIDPHITQQIQEMGSKRPTYGTRRMATVLSRKRKQPINRKRVQRIYRDLGWIVPRKTKKEIIQNSRDKPLKPVRPNQLWQADMTYIWCGIDGWCYCFNVIDVFTRKWLAYMFDVTASKEAAVNSIVYAVAKAKPESSGLVIRIDNGSQYISKVFKESMLALNIRHEFIWRHTPQQNGHIESFHRTLKKEYIWPHEFANFQSVE